MSFAYAAPKLKRSVGGNADWSGWILDVMKRELWEKGGPWVTLVEFCRRHGHGTGEHGAQLADQDERALVKEIMVNVYKIFQHIKPMQNLTGKQRNAVTGTVSRHWSKSPDRQTKTITLQLLLKLALAACQLTRDTSTASKRDSTVSYPNVTLDRLEEVRQMNAHGNNGASAVENLKQLIQEAVPEATADRSQNGSSSDREVRGELVAETASTDMSTTGIGGILTFSHFDLTAWDQRVGFRASEMALEDGDLFHDYYCGNCGILARCNDGDLSFKAVCRHCSTLRRDRDNS
jgi:hypothetical protein